MNTFANTPRFSWDWIAFFKSITGSARQKRGGAIRPSNNWLDKLFSFHRDQVPVQNRVCIAFNETWRDDPLRRRWIVLENGNRRLAEEVSVQVSFNASVAPDSDELAYDYVCLGQVEWIGHRARVT